MKLLCFSLTLGALVLIVWGRNRSNHALAHSKSGVPTAPKTVAETPPPPPVLLAKPRPQISNAVSDVISPQAVPPIPDAADHKAIAHWLRVVAAASPRIRLQLLTRSAQNREVLAVTVSAPNASPGARTVAVVCRQHGDEPAPTTAALRVISEAATTRSAERSAVLQRVQLWIVPMANPDGAAANFRFCDGTNANRDWGVWKLDETRDLARTAAPASRRFTRLPRTFARRLQITSLSRTDWQGRAVIAAVGAGHRAQSLRRKFSSGARTRARLSAFVALPVFSGQLTKTSHYDRIFERSANADRARAASPNSDMVNNGMGRSQIQCVHISFDAATSGCFERH